MDGEELLEKQIDEPKTNVKSRSVLRWPVLALCSFCMFCSYYCYDNPAALSDQFKDSKNTDLSDTQFNSLYSAYSLPNMVLPFFGGYLVDRYGVRRTLLLFAFFLVCGQALFAFGSSIDSGRGTTAFVVMMLGRAVYGLGGESLCVCAQTLLSEWFMGKEMALAMGINLSISRVGSVVNDQTSVSLYSAVNIDGTLWFGVILLSSGFAAALLTAWLDKKVAASETPGTDDAPVRASFAQALKTSFAAGHPGSFADAERRSVHANSFLGDAAKPAKVDEMADFSLSEMWRIIKSFRKCFWMLCIGCVVVYATVMPFNNIASSFLSQKYYPNYIAKAHCQGLSEHEHKDLKDKASHYANIWMMVPFSISAVLSPFLGAFVDRVGMRAALMLVSAAVLTAVHIFLGATHGTPYDPNFDIHSPTASIDIPWIRHPAVGLSMMGLAYSFYAAAVWPAVVYVVEEDQVGTAYGLVTAVQNTGLFLVPQLVGVLTLSEPDCNPSLEAGGYLNVEWMFVAFGAVGVAIGIYLHTLPEGRRLNLKDPWTAVSDDAEENPLSDAVASPQNTAVPRPKTSIKQDSDSEEASNMA